MKEYTQRVLEKARSLQQLEEAALVMALEPRRQVGLRSAVMLAVMLAVVLFPQTGAGTVL